MLDQGRSRALDPVIGVHIREGDMLSAPSAAPAV